MFFAGNFTSKAKEVTICSRRGNEWVGAEGGGGGGGGGGIGGRSWAGDIKWRVKMPAPSECHERAARDEARDKRHMSNSASLGIVWRNGKTPAVRN